MTWPCQLEEVKLVGNRLHYKRITGANWNLQLKRLGVRVVRRFLEMVYLELSILLWFIWMILDGLVRFPLGSSPELVLPLTVVNTDNLGACRKTIWAITRKNLNQLESTWSREIEFSRNVTVVSNGDLGRFRVNLPQHQLSRG